MIKSLQGAIVMELLARGLIKSRDVVAVEAAINHVGHRSHTCQKCGCIFAKFCKEHSFQGAALVGFGVGEDKDATSK